ncbi:hypothetical protein C5749_06320 [Sphingobacterium gobiense]|uniref:RagB/SusD family nutrient uptake outer membrane protein n=2 Tax=Sphingobacterium gobiense TaxID=1382456 RepID=A0A2S9JU71_9SPHI|nr:hypothetical protein C5749_06320 [Sphingobacterium gobiense]
MNNKMKRFLNNIIPLSVIIGSSLFVSCAKFVELGAPPTQIEYQDGFLTDAGAQSVILGLYVSATGNANNANLSSMASLYTGVAADDLQYNGADALLLEFYTNGLLSTNGLVNNVWSNLYQLIKNTNNAVAALEASNALTPATKDQLIGEAKFIRAYAYLYLVNLYGDVPLYTADDSGVFESAVLPRTATDRVYEQILSDLKDAETKLDVAYKGTFRGRVNKHAASALLARVYLYRKDYVNAELYASKVLAATDLYSMPAPSVSFTNNSGEIIFQLANINGVTTFAANYFAAGATSIPAYTLPDRHYQSFETAPEEDLRKLNWITPKTVSEKVYYTITKYKSTSPTIGNEYHVVLRLAEQYLIRAEARANQDNRAGAKADIDAVRSRAGLEGVSSNLTATQMLTAIETERLHELFGEYGHRWFDLKRTDRATAVLAPIKPNWQATDVLFPIPNGQRLANNLLTQNLGYED